MYRGIEYGRGLTAGIEGRDKDSRSRRWSMRREVNLSSVLFFIHISIMQRSKDIDIYIYIYHVMYLRLVCISVYKSRSEICKFKKKKKMI